VVIHRQLARQVGAFGGFAPESSTNLKINVVRCNVTPRRRHPLASLRQTFTSQATSSDSIAWTFGWDQHSEASRRERARHLQPCLQQCYVITPTATCRQKHTTSQIPSCTRRLLAADASASQLRTAQRYALTVTSNAAATIILHNNALARLKLQSVAAPR
jgi:hypothetical protein